MQVRFRGYLTIVIVIAACGVASAQDSSKEPQIEVKVVKYEGLTDVVKQHKGKVVVVDFWTTNCGPCIKGMPQLVRLQEKYGKQGLVAILVNLDEDAQKPEIQKQVKDRLRKQKANVTNLVLDE